MPEKKEGEIKELTESQKRFCQEYIFDYNGTRAYKVAYPESSYDSAKSSAYDNLTKPYIKAYIDELKEDLEKTSGITRLKVLREHEKLAFSSIAHLHDTWITRKEFEKLTDDQKSCIAEIQTQTRHEKGADDGIVQVDYVKIKLYDKQKSLDSISKMLGFDAPKKVDLTTQGEKLNTLPPQVHVYNSAPPLAKSEDEIDV